MSFLLQRVVLSILFVAGFQVAVAQPFVVDTLARHPSIASPVSIAFSPDNTGKFFLTEKSTGRIRVFENDAVQPALFAMVRVASAGEQGLLGVAVHPAYPDSPFVYILYTRSSDRANVIVRYRDSSNIGIQPRVIFTIPRTNNSTTQNGGTIHFGPDGKLYASIGDFGVPSNAADTTDGTNTRGKILRLNPDGSIPSDNPFMDKPFWSYGHHNSFDFTFDWQTGEAYCSENLPGGKSAVVYAAARSMASPVAQFQNLTVASNPLAAQQVSGVPGSLPSLTGIALYRGTVFPRLDGKILLADNGDRTIWVLARREESDPVSGDEPVALFEHPTAFGGVAIGPDGFIYLAVGQSVNSMIMRLRPLAPTFSSSPILQATQDVEYSYLPVLTGTPSEMSIVIGPPRMVLDPLTGNIRWTPTNDDALLQSHTVLIRAQNGAGTAEQEFTLHVANVNDAPSSPTLLSPAGDTTLNFSGVDPTVRFLWLEAKDPDLDTVSYVVEIDTTSPFRSRPLLSLPAGRTLSAEQVFPRRKSDYYWRVRVSDGVLSSTSIERKLTVVFVKTVLEQQEKPNESMLEQNFPNPFNPSTFIKYTIPKSGHVKLGVFNLLGQEVAVIYEGVQIAGTYEFEFKIGDLPSGIYFYRIQAPDFVETKKMIVTK